MLAFFFVKNSTSIESSSMKAVLEIFLIVFSAFVSLLCKVNINENLSFIYHVFGIQIPDCSRLAKN